MSNHIYYFIVFLISVLLSSVSQVLLKKSANEKYRNTFNEYFNTRVILAYTIFFIATMLTIFAYKYVPLSYGPVLESTGYINVIILSAVFLNEKLRIRRILGMIIIVAGIMLFSL